MACTMGLRSLPITLRFIMSEEEEALAYHEAGHAVIAMQLGYRCHWVAIAPKPAACCEEPVDHEHALQILLAARVVEREHTKAAEIWRDGNDKVRATNLALQITDRDTDKAGELINRMLAESRARVLEHWPEIERLARELLIKKRVTPLQTSKQHR